MKVLSAMKKGIGITNRKLGLVIILLIINIIFGLVLGIPMYYKLHNSFGDSMVSENMVEGFDTLWHGEFQHEQDGFASSFKPSILSLGAILNNFVTIESWKPFNVNSMPISIWVLGLLYLIFWTFLNGGVLGTFNSMDRKFSFKNFFGDCGKYFIRFFILTIVALACYILLNKYFFPWLEEVFKEFSFVKNATEEKIPFLFNRLRDFIFLILLFFIGMLFDYAKISIVVDERRNIIVSFFKSLFFILRHIIKVYFLYIILAVIGIIFIALYTLADLQISQNTLRNILIMIGIQQVYMLLKIWLKCTFLSSQMSLYKGFKKVTEGDLIEGRGEPFAVKEEIV